MRREDLKLEVEIDGRTQTVEAWIAERGLTYELVRARRWRWLKWPDALSTRAAARGRSVANRKGLF